MRSARIPTSLGKYLRQFVSVLTENLGYYVVVEFLIGTSGLVQKEGILYNAGNNFITLYQSAEDG